MSVYAVPAVIIAVICIAIVMYLQYAPNLMYKRWESRVESAGGLKWYRIIGESRRVNDSNENDYSNHMDGVIAFIKSMSSSGSFATIVWNKDESSSIKMYIGIPTNTTALGHGTLTTLAGKLRGRLEDSGPPPQIENPEVVQLHRRHYDVTGVQDYLSSVGSLAKQLDESKTSKDCSIILTIEPANISESNRMSANLSESAIMKTGDAARYGGKVGAQAGFMSGTLVRGSVVAVTNRDSSYDSKAFLSNSMSSITTIGYNFDVAKPEDIYRREIMTAAIIGIIPIVLVSIMSGINMVVGSLLIMLIAALSQLHIIFPSQFRNDGYMRLINNGYMAIVRYLFLSPRWLVVSMFRAGHRNDAGGTSMGNRVAPPSHRSVCHFYATSLAQFMSLPMDGSITDIDEDRLPKIGVAERFNRHDKMDMFYGFSGKGQSIMTSVANACTGMFVSGSQQSGKTHYLEVLYMNFAKITKMSDDIRKGIMPWPTQYNPQTGEHEKRKVPRLSPFWFEIKGEAASGIYKHVKELNPRSIFIDTNNPYSQYRLCLEGPRLNDINPATNKPYTVSTIEANITQLVNGMQFAFGDGIKAESKQALQYALLTAMLLNEDEYERLGLADKLNAKKPNIIIASWLLLGGDSEIDLEKLLSSVRKDIDDMHKRIENHEPREGDLMTPRTKMLSHNLAILINYAGKNNAKAQPALNKLTDLRKLKGFWEPREGVREVSLAELVHHFAPIVINFGPYVKSDGNYSVIDKSASNKISLITTSMNWEYVKSACTGWQDKGQYIPVFYDEVKSVAVDSNSDDHPNVLMESHSDGRSKGYFNIAATQDFSQIPDSARPTVYSFYNKVTFKLGGVDDRRQVLKMMGNKDVQYHDTHLSNIEHPFGVIVSLRLDDGNTNPFTIEVPYRETWARYLKRNETVYDAVQDYLRNEELASAPQVRNEYI